MCPPPQIRLSHRRDHSKRRLDSLLTRFLLDLLRLLLCSLRAVGSNCHAFWLGLFVKANKRTDEFDDGVEEETKDGADYQGDTEVDVKRLFLHELSKGDLMRRLTSRIIRMRKGSKAR